MRYITPLFLIALCAATGIHCMDADQKALALKASFATICWFQNAETIKVVANDAELSKESTAQLQQAFLSCLQAPSFEFPDEICTIPVVCLDLKKLAPLLEAVQKLQQTKEEKAEELRKKEKQEKKDKLIAELIQKNNEANKAYSELHWAMTFFMGDNEYWQSDLPRQNDTRLETLRQKAVEAGNELIKHDPTNKRFDRNFLKAWQLDAEGQLKREEKEKETDKLIAQLIQKHRKANEDYRLCYWAMLNTPECFVEYWKSDLPRQNEILLERLKQEAEGARAELEKRDPTNKRYDQNFLKKWELVVKA